MSSRLLVLLCALAAAACAPTAVAPIAAAQEDEVFVDPGSPSGKEYELPIDRARQEAGKSAKRGSSAEKAPLFGEGVERNDGGAAPPGSDVDRTGSDVDRTKDSEPSTNRERRTSRKQPRKAKAASQAEAQEEAREAELARVRALQARAAAAPDGGIGVGGIIAAGVGVLLVGGLIGLWLRRRATT